MRKSFFAILAVLTFSMYTFAQDEPPVIEGIAAIVGDNIILKSDLSQILTMTAANERFDLNANPKRAEQLQNRILQSLIDQKILLEMAELDSIVVEDKDVDNALSQQIDSFIAQAGSEEAAEEALGQSIKSFKKEYWFDMRDKMITEQYQYTLLSSIAVSRREVKQFFETYKDSLPMFPTLVNLHHILLPIRAGDESKKAAYTLLDSLRLEIQSEGDFAQIAGAYSEDPGSAGRGGDLGFVRRGTLVPEFESTAFSLEIGAVSDIVETDFGYHLIEVLEKQGERVRARHILISPDITTADETRAWNYASSIKDSIQNLDNFEEFASRYSIDETTKSVGGFLGWVDPSSYPVREIAQVIYELSQNECSPPIQSSFGYHLLWLGDIRPGGVPNLSLHWTDVEEMALNHKKMMWFNEWMEETKKNFYVKIGSE